MTTNKNLWNVPKNWKAVLTAQDEIKILIFFQTIVGVIKMYICTFYIKIT